MSTRFTARKADFPRTDTFADRLVRYIRDRHEGDAPSVYAAAQVDRRTYSAIISDPFRPVSKRTALLFALALRLGREEADGLLRSAGFALSPAIPEDVVCAEFIARGDYDLIRINIRLDELGLKPL